MASTNSGNVENLNFSGLKVAQVMNNVDKDKEGKIKVYIPSIQYDSDYDEEDSDIDSVSTNGFVSNSNMSGLNTSTVTESNYITLRPLMLYEEDKKSGRYRIPAKNSMVIAIFLDNDPQKGYYLPLNATTEGDLLSDTYAMSSWSNYKKKVNIESNIYPNKNRVDMNYNENESELRITINEPKKSNSAVESLTDDQFKVTVSNGAGSFTLTGSSAVVKVAGCTLTLSNGTCNIDCSTTKITGNANIGGNEEVSGSFNAGSGTIAGSTIVTAANIHNYVKDCTC
jgi:hypothetical protein